MLPYFDFPYASPESLSDGSYVIATYLASGISVSDAIRRSGTFAVGQSIGTWIDVPGITREMISKYQARVLGCYCVQTTDEAAYLLRIAFPIENFGSCYSMLFTALMGNDTSTALNTRLIDIETANDASGFFKGPRKGIDYLRELTGVKNRPLILNMLKPCIGYSPEYGAKLFYEAGRGGIDLIKDDELLGSTSFSQVVERVRAYNLQAQRIYDETGKRPVYIANITAKPKTMRENARACLDAGVKAVMVNFVSTGLDALSEICDEFGNQLFILAHYAGCDVVSKGVGIPVILGKLPRMAGADGVVVMYQKDRNNSGYSDFIRTMQAHRLPCCGMKQTVSVIGGGVSPLCAAELYNDFGKDMVLGVGGAIQGHPDGASAGARAMLRSVEAAIKGVDIDEAASECPELAKAIECWRK